MKQYKAINESNWVEVPHVVLTEDEFNTLNNGTKKQVESLKKDIINRSTPIEIELDELTNVLAIYDEYKPELNEDDVYDLISFDIVIRGDERMGSYNYKLNNNIINVILK